jgi:uncharacterized phage-associated protein
MNIAEQKIINAVIYFVKNTKNCKKTKLFKLIYFLDFIHFKKYGLSVTGLDYIALERGPVPRALLNIFEENKLPPEYSKNFNIEKQISEEDDQYSFNIILKNKQPNLDWFTPNEQKILEEVAFFGQEATANQLIEATHLHNSPWYKVFHDKEKGKGAYIDYFLAIDDETTFDIEEIKERFGIQKEMRD